MEFLFLARQSESQVCCKMSMMPHDGSQMNSFSAWHHIKDDKLCRCQNTIGTEIRKFEAGCVEHFVTVQLVTVQLPIDGD